MARNLPEGGTFVRTTRGKLTSAVDSPQGPLPQLAGRTNRNQPGTAKCPSFRTMALELTDSNFEELALKSDKPVMVDFWAEWCGPCRMVGPVVEELAKEYDGKAVVGKVNVDNNPQVATKYGIRSIPTILFLKNGEVVDRSVGAVPKSQLSQKLDGQLG
ncbi:MAG: thioredoxin [Flavobacteriales bacterium]|nr:thioredoxin [Flavobacteriales bacterium]